MPGALRCFYRLLLEVRDESSPSAPTGTWASEPHRTSTIRADRRSSKRTAASIHTATIATPLDVTAASAPPAVTAASALPSVRSAAISPLRCERSQNNSSSSSGAGRCSNKPTALRAFVQQQQQQQQRRRPRQLSQQQAHHTASVHKQSAAAATPIEPATSEPVTTTIKQPCVNVAPHGFWCGFSGDSEGIPAGRAAHYHNGPYSCIHDDRPSEYDGNAPACDIVARADAVTHTEEG